jgi:hypothetical protein
MLDSATRLATNRFKNWRAVDAALLLNQPLDFSICRDDFVANKIVFQMVVEKLRLPNNCQSYGRLKLTLIGPLC